ncbi:DUF429 domain-containing protein [Halobellus inordinatus]|uniref:DUF429 domain-containing protein n=1 Tax=Halobellus inordinatus TaxID=1126236 RepID=UPI00210DFB59|nr:DUF429 domain-containing protein [Halobellus inordinatus]
MAARSPVVGVDACPAGWVATVLDRDDARIETHRDFAAVADTYADAERVLVDIPIGLPTTSRRRCDEDASDLLGCRGISVFYPPSAAAIDCDDYETASEAHREDVGHGLSRQAFYIGEKIREVASVVGDDYGGRIREAHPELCFAALNGQPIAYAKSSARGCRLRRSLLADALDGAEDAYEQAREDYPLSDAGRDDLLDSMVLAVVAAGKAVAGGPLTTVPADPDADEPRIYYPPFEVV